MIKIIKQFVPWWSKIAIKIVLSRFPLSYHFWGQKLGIFQHGQMLDPEYACEIIDSHYAKTRSYLPDTFVVCELGPGDSLATAMVAPCYGGVKSYLVDMGNYATKNKLYYQQLADFLAAKHFKGFNYVSNFTLNEVLEKNNSYYLTNGLEGLRSLPNETVDLVFSQAVLEHIRLSDISDVIRETYRILKSGGVASHKIDLKDHLGGSLNNLRFSKMVWESNLFSLSGFYTNRLRASEIVELFKESCFKIVSYKESRWEEIPISRGLIHPEFACLAKNDLLISGLEIVVRK